MLKHLLSVAAAALLTAGSAMAQSIAIGETTYSKMSDAVAAAQDGDVIEISGEVIVDSRINFEAEKVYNVKGAGTDAKFVRGEKFTSSLFLIRGNATVNFENLTIDGNNVANVGNKPIEITNAAKSVSFTDCKLVNHIAERVIWAQKIPVTLNGVIAENCTVTSGVIFVTRDNSNVTVAGASDYSVFFEGVTALVGGENLSGNIALNLNGNFAAGRVVVSGGTAVDVFSLVDAPTGYSLVAKDGNIVVVYNNYVVQNETQNTFYTSFDEAVAAAAEADVLILLEDVTFGDRFINKVNNLKLKGKTPEIRLIRNFVNKVFIGLDKSFKLENLVLDCNNMSNNNYEFEAGTGTFTLTNVKIVNSKTTKGLFNVKDTNRTLSLINVTMEDCETEVPNIDLKGKLTLEGDNNLSVNVTFNPGTIVAKDLTNETPIMVTLPEGTELGKSIVTGTADATKFSLTNTGLKLEAGEGNNLVLAKRTSTGIEDVAVSDENAPVEYYNINGMRVNGDNLTPGIYIKRQGAVTTKIYVK